MADKMVLVLEVDDKGTATIKNFSRTFAGEIDKATTSINKMGVGISSIKFAALTYIAQQAAQMTQRIYESGKAISGLADEIERNSRTLGMSIAEYQKWTYAAKMADVSTEDLTKGWKFLSKNVEDSNRGVGEARQYFEALGIKGKTTVDVFMELADRFKAAGYSGEEAGKKIDIATTLAGRGGMALIPMWNLGRSAIEAFKNETVKMGTVLGDVVIKQGGEAHEVFKQIDARINAIKISLGPTILVMANFFKAIMDGIKGVGEASDLFLPEEGAFAKRMFQLNNLWIKAKTPIGVGYPPAPEPPAYYPPGAMEAAGIPFKEGIGITKPLAMPPDKKLLELIEKDREESIKAWGIYYDDWQEQANEAARKIAEIQMGYNKQADESTTSTIESWGIAYDDWQEGAIMAAQTVGQTQIDINKQVEASIIANIEAQGIYIDAFMDSLTDAYRMIADEQIKVNKNTQITIDVFDRFGRSIMDVFDGLILGTLKWQDVTKSLTASVVRQFSDMFLEILKKKMSWEYVLEDNFTIKIPSFIKEGTDSIGGYFGDLWQSMTSWFGGSPSAGYGVTTTRAGIARTGAETGMTMTEAAGVGMTGVGAAAGAKAAGGSSAAAGTSMGTIFSYAIAGAVSNFLIGEFYSKALNSITGQRINPELLGWMNAAGGVAGSAYVFGLYPLMALTGFGVSKNDDKQKAEARRMRYYRAMATMGFEFPINEKDKIDFAAIKEQGGLLGVPTAHLGKKNIKELWARAEDIFGTVKDDFANAISEGMKAGSATAGFRIFESTLKDTVYNNVLEGMVKAFTESTMLKNAMTPLYQFLYESVAGGLEKGFDVGVFKAGITEKMAPITAMITAFEPIFKDIYGAISGLSGGSVSHIPITIPSFQSGGQMPHTGLAYLHSGETINPPGRSGGVTVNLNGTQINNDLDVVLVAKKLGRKIDWERRRPQVYG